LRWNNNELFILRKFYTDKGDVYISKLINRTPNVIRIRAHMLKIKRVEKDIKLSSDEDQIILGSLLGDMYCGIHHTCKNAHIEEAHSKKQFSYLYWKLEKLSSLTFNLRKTKIGALHFDSRVHPILNSYYRLFYKDGKKTVNRDILDKLDALGIAVWYMDDGSYPKNSYSCTLHTNGFSHEENVLIKQWFEEKWDICPKITSFLKGIKRYYFLRFPAKESRKLIELIKPYIHQSMQYKTGNIFETKSETKRRNVLWEIDL